ncbi:MAG: universal stress protein [Archaeoglobaceae archaeon]
MEEFVWKVLLIIDDTELAEKATECAIDLNLSGLKSKMYVFYIKDEEPIAIPSEEVERRKYAPMIAKAEKKLIETAEKLKRAGIDHEILGYYIGIADEEVKRLEKSFEPDLIIYGAERKSGIKKLLKGSCDERIIFETNAPVIVVKSKYTPKIKELIKEVPLLEINEKGRLSVEV